MRDFWLVVLVGLLCLCRSASAGADSASLPRVLIIGDSISMGYTEPVKRLLAGKANVQRVNDNCQSTVYALEHIKEWLGDGKWDVIHFNWGIWDLHHLDDGSIRTTREQYQKNLQRLIDTMKATGAGLVWASTTPVGDTSGSFWVRAADVPTYNALAARVMRRNRIPINDLYSWVRPRVSELRQPDLCHLKPEGSELLAGRVAQSIIRALERRPARCCTPGADQGAE